ESERQRRSDREDERDGVEPAEDGDVADESGGEQQPEDGQQLDAWLDALQQARRRGDIAGEHRLAHQRRRAVERLGDEVAFAPATDAAAGAQAELGLEGTRRRGGRLGHAADPCPRGARRRRTSRIAPTVPTTTTAIA